ncbi:MAG: hypothetical protein ACJ8ER_14715 [Allosphingosinicella sp.]
MKSAPDPAALAADPAWLPHGFDPASETLRFVRLERAARRALPFLDGRRIGPELERATAPLDALAFAPAEGARCHFIFHSAFCGSTLLARALDIEGRTLALKEPNILGSLLQQAAAAGSAGAVERPLATVLALLERPFEPGETILIKPSDGANPLAASMLALRPQAKAVLLYRPLPQFLLSVVRRGQSGRLWARKHVSRFARLPEYRLEAEVPPAGEIADLQVAALGWLQHQATFARLLSELPDRVAAIEAEALFADPAGTLEKAARWFGLGLGSDEAAAIASGPAFAREAKLADRDFDPAARRREDAMAKFAYGEEIKAAVEWAEGLAAASGIPMRLSNPG